MRRTLVVNADDLGLTIGINDGIFDAHDRGILTSASLMANAPAAANAIHSARVKLPGTPGTTFISTIAALTATPVHAMAADSFG